MKRGFTLIELIIVIVIIGLLSSIVLKTMTTACRKSPTGCDGLVKQQTTCTTDQCLKFIRTASSTQQ